MGPCGGRRCGRRRECELLPIGHFVPRLHLSMTAAMRPADSAGSPIQAGSPDPDGVDQAVIHSHPFRRAVLAALAAFATTWSVSQPVSAQIPSPNSRVSASGSFLAARHATIERDAATAAGFYRAALRGDPRNNELLDRAFLSVLANGDV